MSTSHEEQPVFTEEDLRHLPESFPRCVIRDGKIVRADGVPLKWEDYELLAEDFPAVLTKRGELRMAVAPTDTHEKSNCWLPPGSNDLVFFRQCAVRD